MKKFVQFLTSRLFIFALLILLQAAVLVAGLLWLQELSVYFYIFCEALSLIIVFSIVSKQDNPMYKIAWIIPIMMVPVLGGFFYLLFGKRNISPRIRRRLEQLNVKNIGLNVQNPEILAEMRANPQAAKQAYYIAQSVGYPVYKNTETIFLTPGEEKFAVMVEELKKAKKFIFLEYFIIEEGKMWNPILDILTDKVKEGVDVRVMYDDLGSIGTLPTRYYKKLQQRGIKVQVFNPFKPSLDVFMNYRDHRKICVIDGNVGITGGINLADEYINAYEKHGYWKDSSILLRGDAVWSLTTMFLTIWESETGSDENYELYRPTNLYQNDGFVQPFADSPIDWELSGENVYMNMINSATKSICIETPYLIIDNEMMTALCLAAKSGIRVDIVTPHVADKWFVHEVTRSNYKQLIQAGVNIYEFTPGFIHAKVVVVDDEYAVVGTQNFDYRSFYLHFECGVWMYRSSAIQQVSADFKEILKVSQKFALEDCKIPWYKRPIRGFLKVFAPLM